MAVFDVSFLNPKLNEAHKDSETGCIYVGSPDTAYETCRQNFILNSGTQLIKQGQSSALVNEGQKIKDLESANNDLQKIAEQKDQQINQLIQGLEKSSNQISSLNSTNIVLIGILLVSVCVLLLLKFKKQK